MSDDKVPACALLARSAIPSQAGPMTSAGAVRRPAASSSRRVTGSLWSVYRNGSPGALARGSFLRIKNMMRSPEADHCTTVAALPRAALQAATVAVETVGVVAV